VGSVPSSNGQGSSDTSQAASAVVTAFQPSLCTAVVLDAILHIATPNTPPPGSSCDTCETSGGRSPSPCSSPDSSRKPRRAVAVGSPPHRTDRACRSFASTRPESRDAYLPGQCTTMANTHQVRTLLRPSATRRRGARGPRHTPTSTERVSEGRSRS
jgi:hypothetical protein